MDGQKLRKVALRSWGPRWLLLVLWPAIWGAEASRGCIGRAGNNFLPVAKMHGFLRAKCDCAWLVRAGSRGRGSTYLRAAIGLWHDGNTRKYGRCVTKYKYVNME